MRRLLMLPALLLLGASPVDRFDAVVAAPGSHRVLLENDRVRVLRVTVAPGATEPVHEHRRASVMYFERPQPITYITYALRGGVPRETGREEAPAMPLGTTVWAGPEGLHAIRNRGAGTFEAVRVEMKR